MDIDTAPLSANEGIKTRSRGLRGTIADGLGLQETGGIAVVNQSGGNREAVAELEKALEGG